MTPPSSAAAADSPVAAQPSADRLSAAVHRAKPLSREGLSERLFTFLFRGLVYPQIWEDPRVDMQALRLGPGDRMITIASGGCNMMSYLTADPAEILVVDLNKAHVALNRLKLEAVRSLPNYQTFYRFFGEGRSRDNVAAYDAYLAPQLDAESRAYWEARDVLFRRRIGLFSRGLYRHGLLGNFIGYGHLAAWLFGVRLAKVVECRTIEEQRAFFDAEIAPLFDSKIVQWITRRKASLFGLGIPPAQYDSLAVEGGGDMAVVLRRRLEKLICDFPIQDNYFAWQACARSYGPGDAGPVPPYLESRHFDALRVRAKRVDVRNLSVTERLDGEADATLDAYVLLDAQDWMTDAQLNDLWGQITRTAKDGARVIFRTADLPSLLPGRVEDGLLSQWAYDADASARFGAQDRSAIYGGFHLYTRRPRVAGETA